MWINAVLCTQIAAAAEKSENPELEIQNKFKIPIGNVQNAGRPQVLNI
jgi:hypothetical protein